MENNWKEKIQNEFILDIKDDMRFSKQEVEELIERFEIFGNLVFEATKKECADKATLCWKNGSHPKGYPYFAWNPNGKKENGDLATHINKESILSINKPNL